MAHHALPTMQRSMLLVFECSLIIPAVHLDAAVLYTLQFEVRPQAWVFVGVAVPRREAFITRSAMEKHHIAENALGVKHAG